MPVLRDCPGGCGERVGYAKYACRPCWLRLPRAHREAILAAYRTRQQAGGLAAHGEAMRAARDWFTANPRG